jgi:3-hydroxymyristoyl/3-hydroxydecanoyl-(acyl carrier protein) dehydratase
MNLPAAKTIERRTDACRLDIDLAAVSAFAGHFPGAPLLPGVVQVDWAMRFAARIFDLGEIWASDIRIKFRRPIRPTGPLVLELKLSRGRRRLEFAYTSGETAMASGQIDLGTEK